MPAGTTRTGDAHCCCPLTAYFARYCLPIAWRYPSDQQWKCRSCLCLLGGLGIRLDLTIQLQQALALTGKPITLGYLLGYPL